MLDIKINGEGLDLPEDITLSLEWNNPLVEMNELLGDYSLQSKLMWSSTNKRIFGYNNRPDQVAPNQEYECEVWWGGTLVFKGLLLLKDGDRDGEWKFTIKHGKGEVGYKMQNTSLRDLEQQYYIDEPQRYNVAFLIQDFTTGDASITHNGITKRTPYFITGIDTLLLLKSMVDADSSMNLTMEVDVVPGLPSYAVVNFFSVGYADSDSYFNGQEILNSFQYGNGSLILSGSGNFMRSDIVTYPNGYLPFINSSTWPSSPYAQPVWLNPDAFTDSPDWLNFVNHPLSSVNFPMNFYATGYSPCFYVAEVLKCICDHIGLRFDAGVFNDDEELATLVVVSKNLSERRIPLSTGAFEIGRARRDRIGNYLPDVTMGDFLKSIKNLFGLHISIENGSMCIRRISDLLQATDIVDMTPFALGEPIYKEHKPYTGLKMKLDSGDGHISDVTREIDRFVVLPDVATVVDLPEALNGNRLCYVIDEDFYYISSVDEEEFEIVWERYATTLQDEYVVWEADQDNWINSNAGPVLADVQESDLSDEAPFDDAQPRTWKILKSFVGMTSNHFGDKVEEDSLRLCFYRGLQPDSNNRYYPMGSHDSTNYSGQQVGNYELRWDKEKGLYNQFWKPYFAWQQRTRKFEQDYKLDKSHLSTMPQLLLKKWRVYHPSSGQQVYYAGRVRVDLTKYAIRNCEVEVWTV